MVEVAAEQVLAETFEVPVMPVPVRGLVAEAMNALGLRTFALHSQLAPLLQVSETLHRCLLQSHQLSFQAC